MRINTSVPLPGPFTVSGSVPITPRRTGVLALLFKLCWYALVLEAWVIWWFFKAFYIAGVLIHRKATGRPTPIWSSRSRWW